MPKLMVDDVTGAHPLSRHNVAQHAAISDVVAPTKEYITSVGDDRISVMSGIVLTIGDSVYRTAGAQLDASHLDAGVGFSAGRDYYVYICNNDTDVETYKISLNTTFPSSFNENNSRKIGGFHFGQCRRVNSNLDPINSAGIVYGAGWEANVYLGIVPRSVWTLTHRPKCSPEGMVYFGSGKWVDIYISSSDGAGGLKSAFGELPLTGTEGHNWYSFLGRMRRSGKRMLTYAEWIQMAEGSPQGLAENNDNAWSKSTSPANNARNICGGVARAVSAIGVRDAVGNVWEWLDELITNASGRVLMGTTNPTSYTYASSDGGRGGQITTTGTGHGPTTRADASPNSAQGAFAWDTISPLGDTAGGNPNNGNIYEYYDQSLIALHAGGHWVHGVNAGCRAVHLGSYPWSVGTVVGARCACESL
jgi:hypothetical protein